MGKGKEIVGAGGGLVWSRTGSGDVEVVLAHRPAYDDWWYPKGKLESGESEEAAALREVEEETGLQCRLGPELGTTEYRDGRNRRKTVRYWQMRAVGGSLAAANEVDDVRWVPLEEAPHLLSYDRDRDLLAAFEPTA